MPPEDTDPVDAPPAEIDSPVLPADARDLTDCGDGTVDRAAGEECDDGNVRGGDGCSAACAGETTGTCGDLRLEIGAGEECDDGNGDAGDGCSATCQLEPVGATCGDGTTQPGEDCDDGNTRGADGCNATCNLTNATALVAGQAIFGRDRLDGVGMAARFLYASPLAADQTSIWIAEDGALFGADALRRLEVATATVTTVAFISVTDGIATNGTDTVWVAGYDTIEAVSTSPPYTVTTVHSGMSATDAASFHDGLPGTATFGALGGLAWYGGALWMVDAGAAVIRRMEPVTGEVVTVAGAPFESLAAGVDGVGAEARFTAPRHLVSDNSGVLYVSDGGGAAIRAFNTGTSVVTTFAGLLGVADYVDGVPPIVRVESPSGITADGSSVYWWDGSAIRQGILATGAVSTVAGMPGAAGYMEGVGSAAQFGIGLGIAYHFPTRTLYVSDDVLTIRAIR